MKNFIKQHKKIFVRTSAVLTSACFLSFTLLPTGKAFDLIIPEKETLAPTVTLEAANSDLAQNNKDVIPSGSLGNMSRPLSAPNANPVNHTTNFTVAPAMSANLVKNADFEKGIEGWTPYGGQANHSEIISEGENKFLQVQNLDGKTHVGIKQTIKFTEPFQGGLLIRLKIKADELGANALAGLDLGLKYADGSPVEYYIGSLRAAQEDLGKWVEKEAYLFIQKPLKELEVIGLAYYDKARISFDDIEIIPVSFENSIRIVSGDSELLINPLGYVDRLTYKGADQLSTNVSPIAQLVLSDGKKLVPAKFELVSGQEYRVTFRDSDISMKMEILPREGYLKFRVTEFLNPGQQALESIEFIHLDVMSGRVIQLTKDWAVQAPDDALFMNALPLNLDTACEPQAGFYTCQALPEAVNQAAGVLILAPKKDYYATIEKMILAEGLPYVGENGEWFRANGASTEPYLLAAVTHDNHEELLKQAIAGGFKQVLMIDPLVWGSYNKPRTGAFAGLDQMVADMRKFVDAGIKVGLHTFMNHMNYLDPNFRLEDLLKVQIGTLADDLTAGARTLPLDPATFDRKSAEYYGLLQWTSYTTVQNFKIQIGNEVIRVSTDLTGGNLKEVVRSVWKTLAAAHAKGEAVYLIPEIYGSFGFMRPGTVSQNTAAANIAELSRRLEIDFIYADGFTYPPAMHLEGKIVQRDLEKNGLWPYLQKIREVTGKYPLVQYGDGKGASFSYYYSNRIASWDGVVYDNKDFTRDYKAARLQAQSPYANALLEMGWWKFHGADLGSGHFDYEATTDDDLHYAMIKTLANLRSMGLELGSSYEKNSGLDHLFELMGQYHELIRTGIEKQWFGRELLDHLAKPEVEAELVNGTDIIEKKVRRLQALLGQDGSYAGEIENPFEAVRDLKLEIRPEIDYYGYSDPGNKMITDFTDPGKLQLVPSSENVSCSIGSDGTLSVTNHGISAGACTVVVPGPLDLSGQRGIGLGITGDGKSESVLVRLRNSATYALREFKDVLDSSGHKELILGQPVTNSDLRTHWDFDYEKTGSIEITIGDIKSGQTSTMKLEGLKSLQEKGASPLVDPSLEIGGITITFPVTLYVDDDRANILEYNGASGEYKVYTSNRTLLLSGQTQTLPASVLAKGKNMVRFRADTASPENSGRADLRFSVYDSQTLFHIPETIENRPPVSNPVSATTPENTTLQGQLTGADPEGDPLRFSLVAQAEHGKAVLNEDGTYIYTPAEGYHGPDSFTYKINDGLADSAVATVSLVIDSVNKIPVAESIWVSTMENTASRGQLPGTDPDGDPLRFSLAAQAEHGKAVLNEDGTYAYTPAEGYRGTDFFMYKINDGEADSAIAMAIFTIHPANNIPIANSISVSTLQDTILQDQLTGTDPDGDPLKFSVIAPAAHGEVNYFEDGTYTYTPAAGYFGTDSFTYVVNDGQADSEIATVNLTIHLDMSANLVKNADFEKGLEGWIKYGNGGTQQIVEKDGKKVLEISNSGQGKPGVYQNIDFPSPVESGLYIRYRVKAETLGDKTLASLNLGLFYADGSPVEFLNEPFRVAKGELGQWIEKEVYITPLKPLSKIVVYCLVYDDLARVYFDDIVIKPVAKTEYVRLEAGDAALEISPTGYVTHLLYKGVEQRTSKYAVNPLAQVQLSNGMKLVPQTLEQIAEHEYRLTFRDSSISLKIEILPKDGYLKFQVLEFNNPKNEAIQSVEFLHIENPYRVAQANKAWATDAGEDTLFMNALPLNIDTACGSRGTFYTCQALPEFVNQAAGVLILTPQKDYYKTIEKMILTEGLPYVEQNGEWFRANGANTEPYLFATFTHDNHEELLRQAVAGGFKQVLMNDPLMWGSYNKPRFNGFYAFDSLDQMVEDMRKFVDAGIKVGLHTFMNQVHYRDPNFRIEDLFKVQIGTLSQDLTAEAQPIPLDPATFEKAVAEHYGLIKFSGAQNFKIQIGDEVIQVSTDLNGGILKDVVRSLKDGWKTIAAAHAKGTPVYLIPEVYGSRAYMRPGTVSQNTAAANIAELSRRLEINFIYADGFTYPEPMPSNGGFVNRNWEKDGLWPYLQKIKEVTGKYPMVQYGYIPGGSFAYYYNNRGASSDGAVFENKDFTRAKATTIFPFKSPYADTNYEMGWWKFHGADLGSGRFDYEATTDDDLHYAMIKTLAYSISMGLQLGSVYEKNAALDHLLELMGQYHELIRTGIEKNWFSRELLDYLARPEVEAEFVNGNDIIEKKVRRLQALLTQDGSYTGEIENPFDGVRNLKLEIRPEIDYYGYSDSRNQTITDFTDPSKLQVVPSSENVSCSIGSDGTLSVTNSGTSAGACTVVIPGPHDLTGQRGIGLGIEGDGKSESVLVRLKSGLYAYREFKDVLDFSNAQEIILAQPSTTSDVGANNVRTNNDFDYKNTTSIELVIGDIKAGQTSTVKLQDLKSLKEKPASPLVNPSVEIGGVRITFLVTLYVDDTRANILEYDGATGEYKVYTSNRTLLLSGRTQALPTSLLAKGKNAFQFRADTASPENSTRADLRFSVYDSKILFRPPEVINNPPAVADTPRITKGGFKNGFSDRTVRPLAEGYPSYTVSLTMDDHCQDGKCIKSKSQPLAKQFVRPLGTLPQENDYLIQGGLKISVGEILQILLVDEDWRDSTGLISPKRLLFRDYPWVNDGLDPETWVKSRFLRHIPPRDDSGQSTAGHRWKAKLYIFSHKKEASKTRAYDSACEELEKFDLLNGTQRTQDLCGTPRAFKSRVFTIPAQ